MPIKPGDMGRDAPSNATPADFAGSMAATIESELNRLLRLDGLEELIPTNDNSPEARDRRRLFVAIARGVVRHLDEQVASIRIAVPDGLGGPVTVSPTLDIVRTTLPGNNWP